MLGCITTTGAMESYRANVDPFTDRRCTPMRYTIRPASMSIHLRLRQVYC